MMNMDVSTRWQALLKQTQQLAEDGGWLMMPLTALAFFIYFESIRLYLRVCFHPVYKSFKRGLSQKLINWLSAHAKIDTEMPLVQHRNIEHLRSHVLQHFERRSRMIARCVKMSPLLGLLGTVIGMLGTFGGMMGQGLDATEDMVAGISQALITTQYGLLIAIPGMVGLAMVRRSLQRLHRQFLSLKLFVLMEERHKLECSDSKATRDGAGDTPLALCLGLPKVQSSLNHASIRVEGLN